jgi:hypothetical protein
MTSRDLTVDEIMAVLPENASADRRTEVSPPRPSPAGEHLHTTLGDAACWRLPVIASDTETV